MGKILKFTPKPVVDHEAEKLVRIANAIDAVVLRHLQEGDVDARDMAALLAHRLGTLLNHMDGKTTLWEFCEKVLRQQAALDEII